MRCENKKKLSIISTKKKRNERRVGNLSIHSFCLFVYFFGLFVCLFVCLCNSGQGSILNTRKFFFLFQDQATAQEELNEETPLLNEELDNDLDGNKEECSSAYLLVLSVKNSQNDISQVVVTVTVIYIRIYYELDTED